MILAKGFDLRVKTKIHDVDNRVVLFDLIVSLQTLMEKVYEMVWKSVSFNIQMCEEKQQKAAFQAYQGSTARKKIEVSSIARASKKKNFD